MATPLIVMGVQGCGKSTIGQMLADATGQPFYDGDDLHSQANKEKMAAGIPLTDQDRQPWLESIAQLIAEQHAQGRSAIVGCSALKRQYRDTLRSGVAGTEFVHLAGSFEVLSARVQARSHEYMPTTLLESQFATLEQLERDEAGVVVSVELSPQEIVNQVLAHLGAQ